LSRGLGGEAAFAGGCHRKVVDWVRVFGCSNKVRGLFAERERACGGLSRFRKAVGERVYGEVERRPVKTLSIINVFVAHALGSV